MSTNIPLETNVLWGLGFAKWHKPRYIQKETSTEMSPSNWPDGKSVMAFFFVLCGRTLPTMGGAMPEQVVLGSIKKQTESSSRSNPASSTPSRQCLVPISRILPWVPDLTFFGDRIWPESKSFPPCVSFGHGVLSLWKLWDTGQTHNSHVKKHI